MKTLPCGHHQRTTRGVRACAVLVVVVKCVCVWWVLVVVGGGDGLVLLSFVVLLTTQTLFVLLPRIRTRPNLRAAASLRLSGTNV